jgi:hypothetical protein
MDAKWDSSPIGTCVSNFLIHCGRRLLIFVYSQSTLSNQKVEWDADRSFHSLREQQVKQCHADFLNIQRHIGLRQLLFAFLMALLMRPLPSFCEEFDWSIGAYAGQYYDSEPAGWTQGRANYLDQYMVALTASKTIWRSQTLPMSVEIDGMIGQQSGIASLTEIAVVPVLRWSSFPWRDKLQTDLRLGPLGVSYTSSVSSLERGTHGRGSQTLGFLIIELAFSRPSKQSDEYFMRLHHRCSVYDTINNYGANGEDYFAFGYRRRF